MHIFKAFSTDNLLSAKVIAIYSFTNGFPPLYLYTELTDENMMF